MTGLCSRCTNARELKTKGGSTLILCELSKQDPSFPKFPPLPVLSCPGYTKN